MPLPLTARVSALAAPALSVAMLVPAGSAQAAPAASARALTKTYGRGDAEVHALRGVDVDFAAGAFTAISAEAMITADPDVILVMTQGAATVGGPEGVLTLPGVADTEAGRNGRVVQMDESQILAFGPEVGLVLGALARSIYA